MKEGLEVRAVLEGAKTEKESKALRECIFEVASQAHGHLEKARELEYDRKAVYALMPSLRSAMYLEALRQADFDPAHPSLFQEESHLAFQLKCLHASIFNKI